MSRHPEVLCVQIVAMPVELVQCVATTICAKMISYAKHKNRILPELHASLKFYCWVARCFQKL